MITIALAVLTCSSAIISAVYWWKSSQVTPVTMDMYDRAVSSSDAPEQFIGAHQVSIDGIKVAANESARLNKWAAIWTGISALLSAATTVSGI